jgi:hypothetical protein
MSDLNPTPCHVCGQKDFYTADVIVGGQAVAIRLSFFATVAVKGQVCLTCGSITPKVDRSSLPAIRAAKAKAESQ